jgi:hypothetical protein
MRLLIDKNKEQLVFHLRQDAFGTATDLPLAWHALQGLVRRIQRCIGGRKRREETRKLSGRQSGRREERSRSVL